MCNYNRTQRQWSPLVNQETIRKAEEAHRLHAAGWRNEDIAQRLGVSVNRVREYLNCFGDPCWL